MQRLHVSAGAGCAGLSSHLDPAETTRILRRWAASFQSWLAKCLPEKKGRQPFAGGLDGLSDHLLRDIGLEQRMTAAWRAKRRS